MVLDAANDIILSTRTLADVQLVVDYTHSEITSLEFRLRLRDRIATIQVVLINQAVHTLDLMQWLMGDPVSVTSTYNIYNHNIETEDFTASIVKFKSGATATFVSSTCCYPGLSTDVQLYGTKGAVELNADVLKLWKQEGLDERDEEDMLDRYGKGNRIACAYDGTKYGHVTQIDDMIDAVIEGRDPQIMPLESIKTIRIIEAIYKSARTGETVYFD